MNRVCKAAIGIVLAVVISVVVTWAYLSVNIQKILYGALGNLTDRKISVTAVYPAFFSGVVMKGLSIEGLLTAGKVRADLDLLALLHQEFRITRLRLDDVGLSWDSSVGGNPPVQAAGDAVHVSQRQGVIEQVLVHSATLQILAQGEPIFRVEKIHAALKNVPLTGQALRTDFSFTGSLGQTGLPFVGHFLKGQGWLNWSVRDMDATAQAVDDDGRVSLDARCVSLKNELSVDGKARILSGQQAQASGARVAGEGVVLGVLEATNADIEATFSFKTQMDHPVPGPIRFQGNITSDLNSDGSSSNIVHSLKVIGEQLLKDGTVTPETK